MAWSARRDLQRAIRFAEQPFTMRPEMTEDWLRAPNLYDAQQRFDDAKRARGNGGPPAVAITEKLQTPSGPPQQH